VSKNFQNLVLQCKKIKKLQKHKSKYVDFGKRREIMFIYQKKVVFKKFLQKTCFFCVLSVGVSEPAETHRKNKTKLF